MHMVMMPTIDNPNAIACEFCSYWMTYISFVGAEVGL